MTMTAQNWYVAQLKPNGYERAMTNLARQGFETFMPMREKTVRHARQLRTVRRPIFSGYLFICFGADRDDWRKINSTLGVARLVSFDKAKPVPMPAPLIAGLKARCADDGVLAGMDDLKIGEQVRMVAGPFVDFIARVETFLSTDSIRLLFECMGQKSHIDMSVADVEKL